MFKHKIQNEISISNKDFDKIKNKALIIDVRDTNEYQILKKIANANGKLNIINIPYYDLVKNPSQYIKDKNQIIVTICNAGNRSTAAALTLRELGYPNAHVLSNGIYGYYKK